MAKLLKENARKPLMEEAAAVASQAWEGSNQFYRLDLFQINEKHHSVMLTRAEMLGVVSEWLKIEARAATVVKR